MTLLQEFGQFIEASYQASFTPSTIHSARRALLDWHGALIAGADTDAASKLREAYQEELQALRQLVIRWCEVVRGHHALYA